MAEKLDPECTCAFINLDPCEVPGHSYVAASSSLLPVPTETISVPIIKLIEIRNLIVREEYNEAYHVLYSLADPEFSQLEPWKKWKKLASLPVGESQPRTHDCSKNLIASEERGSLGNGDWPAHCGQCGRSFRNRDELNRFAGRGEFAESEPNKANPSSSGDALKTPPLSNERPAFNLGLGESREPLTYDENGHCSDAACPCHHAGNLSLEEMYKLEENHPPLIGLRRKAGLPSVPAEIESLSSDVSKSSNETRNI